MIILLGIILLILVIDQHPRRASTWFHWVGWSIAVSATIAGIIALEAIEKLGAS